MAAVIRAAYLGEVSICLSWGGSAVHSGEKRRPRGHRVVSPWAALWAVTAEHVGEAADARVALRGVPGDVVGRVHRARASLCVGAYRVVVVVGAGQGAACGRGSSAAYHRSDKGQGHSKAHALGHSNTQAHRLGHRGNNRGHLQHNRPAA